MNHSQTRLFKLTIFLIAALFGLAVLTFALTFPSNPLLAALAGMGIVFTSGCAYTIRKLQLRFEKMIAADEAQSHMKRIRDLERMRSEFVANVSHELKTPVAAVKGFAETLLSGAMDDKETAEQFLQIIYDESDRLDRLIGDLTELSKIESGRSPLNFVPLNVQELLEDVERIMKSMAQDKKIQIRYQSEDSIYIEADEDRLRQILFNLISNAINYTPDEGRVDVVASIVKKGKDNEVARIIISDTGIGIPRKDLPRIFERFYRVDKARSRRSGGTGLGLSIVKHLVELHKGTIHAESESGLGTKLTIELPVLQL